MEDIKERVLNGYEKLAFGDVSDPIRLLFQEKVTSAALRRMNLFNIAQIKKKDSEVDIKFFDRIKALQCMQDLEKGESSGASDFLTAVQKAAEIMQDDDE